MQTFLHMLKQYRFLWAKGRFGGGKTTLALKLADMLIGSKFCRYTVVNFPLLVDAPFTVTTDTKEIQAVKDAVLILDEAGQFLDAGSSAKHLKEWFSYLRKNNQVVILASVLPVARFATQFTVQRLFNGLQMGVPFWAYRWRLGVSDTKDDGRFLWWNPQQVWGLYDTDHKPDDRWYIYDWQDADTSGDGAEVELGIEGQYSSDSDPGWADGGGTMGGELLLELSGVKSRARLPELASHGYSAGDGSGWTGG